MKRSGFTMVELIFVIIIIGILSVAAIPKFGDIKDRAKVNSEYSALSGLSSALVAKMEFYKEDNPTATTLSIDWHDYGTYNGTSLGNTYKLINDAKKVFKGVTKKGDDFQIVAYYDYNGNAWDNTDKGVDDIIFIKGAASNALTGVSKATDVPGKPDKNDVWVFNGTPETVTIDYDNGKKKEIESGEIALIDIAGETAVAFAATAAANTVVIDKIGSSDTDVAPSTSDL